MTWKIVILVMAMVAAKARAQDPPRGAPPPKAPPPLEQDFEDPDDEEDAPVKGGPGAAVPPPAPASNAGQAAPVTDFRPPSAAASGPAKLKFQVVDGEFYEKGKKRGRTPQNKRTQSYQ
jgi:hypothetical protein